jgi:exopolyphosphatase/guanosine-5'-triphosphate,3'-diphosphate pyrophosphatase
MRFGILDIGYNAVRAVVYENDMLGAPEVFNDKFRSDVHTLLQMENLDIKHQTYLCLKYLKHIFDNLSVGKIRCVATAVLRGHPRAEEFSKVVKNRFNIDIDIISGETEAYLTAAGLLSGIEDASGIAADLGGGSLELAVIGDRKVGTLKSLPLGTKVITSSSLNELHIIKEMIYGEFGDKKIDNLYLIGGGFRLLGRFYMEFTHYPLRNLHNLEISRVDFDIYLEKLDRLQRITSLYNRNKIDPNAILVARAIMEVFEAKKIIISNYGLKEGVRFVSLPSQERAKDIIYERVKTWVKFNDTTCRLDKYVEAVVHLLIAPDQIVIDVLKLAVMFANFNKNIDRTLQADFAVESVLASDVPFSHRKRVMLATSLSCAYGVKHDLRITKLAKRIITKQDYANAQIIGNFIKISKEVDGPEFLTPSFSLLIKGKHIEIATLEILPRAIFVKVCDRLKDISLTRRFFSNNSTKSGLLLEEQSPS